MKIAANLKQLCNDINDAESRFQRKRGSVCLLAVSKTRSVDEIRAAIRSGQQHFGENYCQEAIEKIDAIAQKNISWHFIGPVQSNKTRQIAQYFDWVHSIDRLKIARRLNDSRSTQLPPLNICVQINISGEQSKSGIALSECENVIDELAQFKQLNIRGLMALPAPTNDFDEQRAAFSQLNKKLFDLKQQGYKLDTLSMGTTQDMDAAIAEGATMVRIGTAIFGERT